MFEKKVFLLFVVPVFLACEAAFVDNLERCKVTDYECTKQTLQTALTDIGESGVPELGIPPIDPFPMKNVTVSVPNMVDIILDGVSKGIKDCVVQKLETHPENEHATMEMTCDITLKGRYKVTGNSPLIKNLFGGSTVHGEGLGQINLDKFYMKFDYHILVQNIDKENYIKCQYEDLKYTHSLGKATFAASGLYIGNKEASGVIISMLNDNRNFIIDSFGKPLLDKAMDIVYEQSHYFFHNVPTKYYLLDDLSSYVQCEGPDCTSSPVRPVDSPPSGSTLSMPFESIGKYFLQLYYIVSQLLSSLANS